MITDTAKDLKQNKCIYNFEKATLLIVSSQSAFRVQDFNFNLTFFWLRKYQ